MATTRRNRRELPRRFSGFAVPCSHCFTAHGAVPCNLGPPVRPDDHTLPQHGTALCVTAISAARCPLWVKSRHRKGSAECPLYPQKRTLIERVRMSALGQKRTSRSGDAMSALPPKADIGTQSCDVCFVPIADISLLPEPCFPPAP